MILLGILFGLALVFSFFNGFHDSSNIVATIISSRALPPRWALMLTAVAEFSGAVVFGLGGGSRCPDDRDWTSLSQRDRN